MKSLRVLQAIAGLCDNANLRQVLDAQIEYVREALPVATSRMAVEWMLSQPWQTQQEFFPAGYEDCKVVLDAIANGRS